MASKHLGASVVSKASIFPVMQTAQQAKFKVPPLSPLSSVCILKDLQDVLGNMARQIKEEMEEFFENKIREMREDILFAFRKFVGHIEHLDDRIVDAVENWKKLEDRIDKVENKVEIIQDEITMLQYKDMEFALRIRGMKENMQEDLRQVVVKDIAFILGAEPEEILRETEKVFRVNSRVARQRNLPRDMVIYLITSLCNEILQAFYKQRFQIAAKDVIILKEIPSKILRKRKDFAFLADELKKQQVRFRWEIPAGIVVNYAGIYYRLNTISKVKDFYTSVLKAGSPSSSRLEIIEEKLEEQLVDVGDIQAEPLQQSLVTEDFLKKPRMTRAPYRRKDKEEQKADVGIKKRK